MGDPLDSQPLPGWRRGKQFHAGCGSGLVQRNIVNDCPASWALSFHPKEVDMVLLIRDDPVELCQLPDFHPGQRH